MARTKPKEQLPPRLRMAYSTIAALEQDIRALQLQLHQANSQLDQARGQYMQGPDSRIKEVLAETLPHDQRGLLE